MSEPFGEFPPPFLAKCAPLRGLNVFVLAANKNRQHLCIRSAQAALTKKLESSLRSSMRLEPKLIGSFLKEATGLEDIKTLFTLMAPNLVYLDPLIERQLCLELSAHLSQEGCWVEILREVNEGDIETQSPN